MDNFENAIILRYSKGSIIHAQFQTPCVSLWRKIKHLLKVRRFSPIWHLKSKFFDFKLTISTSNHMVMREIWDKFS